jgi:glycosyltransferase involved in cell wall biosynthesis
MKPALLIALPTGLTIGGVQSWAVRLANGLARRGRAVGLLLHAPTGPQLQALLHADVQVFETVDAPALEQAAGGLAPFLHPYERAIAKLADLSGAPVVCAPNLLGDCYGILAALSKRADIRVVGWCHSAIPYDLRVLEYYEPLLAGFVAVSDFLETAIRTRMPQRAGDVHNIACGVEIGEQRSSGSWAGSPCHVVYLGRLDDDIKRVSALPLLSDRLAALGILHRITVVGDGPATLAQRPTITHIKSASPAQAAQLLRGHDIFVLPSRVEGLSLSMLEAMAAGCVPVVTRTESGAAQVLDGANGLIVDPVGASFDDVAAALAAGIASVLPRLPHMSVAAQATIQARFSLDRHLDAVESLIDAAAAAPARVWPAGRAPAFTSNASTGSGSVPPDGAARLRATLETLEGRRVAIHGTGRHTIELAAILAQFTDRIVAFTDDDPARRAQSLQGLPILAPGATARAGVTDVVISSWINQEQIWNGRGVYEAQGVAVHRLYAAAA